MQSIIFSAEMSNSLIRDLSVWIKFSHHPKLHTIIAAYPAEFRKLFQME
jgi:hypothetical protein